MASLEKTVEVKNEAPADVAPKPATESDFIFAHASAEEAYWKTYQYQSQSKKLEELAFLNRVVEFFHAWSHTGRNSVPSRGAYTFLIAASAQIRIDYKQGQFTSALPHLKE